MAGKVLIVEDEMINAMALSEVIPGWGCIADIHRYLNPTERITVQVSQPR